MLKVVGASWVRTRISTFIILGAILLAICALFFTDMEKPVFGGNYCATVYHSDKSGYHIEFWGQQNDLASVPRGVARICYKNTIDENGWSQIELESQADYPDNVQAFAAGYLEGALTWDVINSHWSK